MPKCTFSHSTVEFLGHQVSASVIKPLPGEVEALPLHPQPSNIKELLGFLGLLNFYGCFIPKADKLLAPLTEVLKGSPNATIKL